MKEVTKKNGHYSVIRLIPDEEESIKSITWSRCPKILFCGSRRIFVPYVMLAPICRLATLQEEKGRKI